ncbi:MAG: TolC family protein, partial [Chlorobi bacterium]|nr:TolC family protein [Chlorobiota bacterium]
RLFYVVPLALLLIFVLLYFAFDSVKLSALIYTAIPLATIGGIWALWLRDMPFSISAGIGFIALFGVAVLNGIVLIEHFRELHEKYNDMNQLIIQGAKDRMRPVLLTALAAMGGFLPMAVSQSAGAEVQRPLATVVIGGLFTSTLLTLMVIPVLYALYIKPPSRKRKRTGDKNFFFFLFLLGAAFSYPAKAQDGEWKSLLDTAAARHPAILKAEAMLRGAEAQRHGIPEMKKTFITYENDPTNPDPANGYAYKTFTLSQGFKFPSWYAAQKKELDAAYLRQQAMYELEKRRVFREVSLLYFDILYEKNLLRTYNRLDSLYASFEQAARRRYELGESNRLEFLTAQAKRKRIGLKRKQVQTRLENYRRQLTVLLGISSNNKNYIIHSDSLYLLPPPSPDTLDNSYKWLFDAREREAYYGWKKNRRNLLPDWQVSFSYGNNFLPGHSTYRAYMVGIGIPLLGGSRRAAAKRSRLQWESIRYDNLLLQRRLRIQKEKLLNEWNYWQQQAAYYKNEGRKLAAQLFLSAQKAYKAGEIDYFRYVQTLENAMEIETGALEAFHQYNTKAIKLKYLTFN